jgi:hypothetical protein
MGKEGGQDESRKAATKDKMMEKFLSLKKVFPIMRNPVCARLCVLIACDRSDMWTIPAQ